MLRTLAILATLVLASCSTRAPEPAQGRRERLEWIAAELESAYERFDARDFIACMSHCRRVEDLDPGYLVAKELWEDAATLWGRRVIRSSLICWN
jgi:hypothetical protein